MRSERGVEHTFGAGLRTPLRALTAALGVSLAMVAVAFWYSLQQPWLGVATVPEADTVALRVTEVYADGPSAGILRKGDVLLGLGASEGVITRFDARDMLPDPDFLPTFEELNIFFGRQQLLHAALSSPVTHIELADGREVKVQTRNGRPPAALPWSFWALNVYGVAAILIGSWVWGAAKDVRPAALLLGSGLGFLILCSSVSVIIGREIALPESGFRWWQGVYHLGNNLFSLFFIALLWNYPSPREKQGVLWVVVLWVVFAWLNERFQWTNLPGHNTETQVAILWLTGFVTVVFQWLRSRNRPADRAVLKFLCLSIVLFSVAAVVAYYHAGQAMGSPPISIEAALGMVLAVYFLLVFGVIRYRLFDVDRWWLYIWIWLAAGTAILGMDAIITMLLPQLSKYSLVIALVFIGWIYFPIRQWLWEKAFPATVAVLPEQLPGFILRLVTERRGDPEDEWRKLLKEVFMPLQIEASPLRAREARLLDSGERLYVPGMREGGYELCLADHGGRLFTPRDARTIDAVAEIARRLSRQLDEYQRGVKAERDRIMRDLHDDVGGRLLTLVHQCESQKVGAVAREALDALREVIYFSLDADAGVTLSEAVARWRSQLRDRLEQRGVRLEWDWEIEDDDLPPLPAIDMLNIGRILQEAVSNALRHAAPKSVQVVGRMRGGELMVTVVNDVTEAAGDPDGPAWLGGKGIPNMERRAEEMGGRLSVDRSGGSHVIELRVPVRRPQEEE